MLSNKELSFYKHRAAFALWFLVLVAAFVWAAAASAQELDEGVPLDTNAKQCGMLVYDWTDPVTVEHRGFPRNTPPDENGDWTKPVNYAEGTLHFRVKVFSQPKPQDMQLQYCVWQDSFNLENCANREQVNGTDGQTVAEWSTEVSKMWKKGGNSIDWTRPRQKDGIAIKNSDRLPVSNYKKWQWNGENPDEWYPIIWRFTVRVVPNGADFKGWNECLGAPTAVSLSGMDAQGPSDNAAAPVILTLAAVLAVISLAAVRHTGLFKQQV